MKKIRLGYLLGSVFLLAVLCVGIYFGLFNKAREAPPATGKVDGSYQGQPQGDSSGNISDNDGKDSGSGSNPIGVMPNFTAPDFELTGLSGRKLKLSDYRDKYVLVNFWRMGSVESEELLSRLQELNNTTGKSGDLVILAVSFQEDMDEVKAYLSSKEYDFAVLPDSGQAAAKAFDIKTHPTTFLIKPGGEIEELWTTSFEVQEIIDRIYDAS